LPLGSLWEDCKSSRKNASANEKPDRRQTPQRRVSIIRKRAQFLGTVEAADQPSAEKAAVKMFDLDDEQRRRLIVQERD
jgi:hypothetical protein